MADLVDAAPRVRLRQQSSSGSSAAHAPRGGRAAAEAGAGAALAARRVGIGCGGGCAPPPARTALDTVYCRPGVCESCGRADCVSVRPPPGFFTAAEVGRHCTPDDVWVVAHGRVYDASRYLTRHPGGTKSIMKRAGGAVDATEDFEFHSKLSQHKVS